MKKPPLNGMALSESLYGLDESDSDSKVSIPTHKRKPSTNREPVPDDNSCAAYPRPSIIPGVEYPISDKEEKLLDLAWQHAIRTQVMIDE